MTGCLKNGQVDGAREPPAALYPPHGDSRLTRGRLADSGSPSRTRSGRRHPFLWLAFHAFTASNVFSTWPAGSIAE